jgi:hypothetical protein
MLSPASSTGRLERESRGLLQDEEAWVYSM